MKKSNLLLFLSSFLILFITSCTSLDPDFLTPLKANKPELRFWYLKNGQWKEALGTSADHFNIGDPKKFKVQVHPKMKKCEVSYQDGNIHDTVNCDDKRQLVIDMGKYTEISNSSISLSVLSENAGTQFGHFQPYTNTLYNPIPLSFKCPQISRSGGLYTCIRPGEFKFKVKVDMITDPNEVVELKFSYRCNDGYRDNGTVNLDSSGHIFEFDHEYSEFCTLGFGLIDGSDKYASFLYIRYYDKEYTPNPDPYKKGSKWCIDKGSSLYAMDNKYKRKHVFTRKCRRFKRGDIQLWNPYGQYNLITI